MPRSPYRFGIRAWLLLGGYALENTGIGLIWPFLVVYLTSVRGMPASSAGLAMSVSGIAGVLATPVSGILSDRLGPRLIVSFSLALAATASLAFVQVSTLGAALLWAAVAGAGLAAMWNSFSALLVTTVPPDARTDAFGAAFALQNLGTGLGAAAGAALLDIALPATFERAFLTAFAIFAVLMAMLLVSGRLYDRPRTREPAGAENLPGSGATGLRPVLADRTLRILVLLNFSFAVTVVALQTLIPLWIVGPLGHSARLVGAVVSADTATIVVTQSLTLRLIRGRSRMASITVASSFLGVATVVYLNIGLIPPVLWPLTLLAGAAIGGFGLTFFQPSIAGMLNDLAPVELLGTYNAALNSAYQSGAIVAPALVGWFAAGGRFREMFLGVLVGQALIGLVTSVTRRSVPRNIDVAARIA